MRVGRNNWNNKREKRVKRARDIEARNIEARNIEAKDFIEAGENRDKKIRRERIRSGL